MNPMTTTDGQVDQILGSAYQVIKYVASNMESLISLAESVDPLVNSMQTAFEALRRTYSESGYTLLKATFKTGAALGTRSHVLIDDASGIAYSWEGALPKYVPEGSTLDSTGGIGVTSWVARDLTSLRQQLSQPGGVSLVGNAVSDSELEQQIRPIESKAIEALRRSYKEAGYIMVVGSFELGGVLNSTTDVLLNEATNTAYSWLGALPKVVLPLSSPETTGGIRPTGAWVDVSDVSLRGGLPKVKYYDGVVELKAATGIANGDKVCSGQIEWDVKTVNTFGKCLPLQNGLFAYPKNAINILDFGADNTGLVLVNNALNDAADVGPVYAPPGRYRVENFERRVQPGHTNIGQEKLAIYGDLSPYTLQHQYMVTPAIFEGDGDLFKKVVNYAFANIGVRNRSSLPTTYPDVPGTLFSMYGKGLEAGVFIGCYFGACLRHFSQVAAGGIPTTADDYMIGPNYDACSFFHAIEYSRYFDGVVANYSETGKCYTSHSKRGLYMKAPGPGVGLVQSVYEYIDDECLIIDAYGFVANYSISLDRVFMESCGGDLADIAGKTKPEKTKAIPSIKIATLSANGAKVLFEHNNCFATYTGAHPPVAHFSIPAGNGTTTVQMAESGFLNGVVGAKTYTADANVYEDPFTTDNSLHQIKDGVETVKGLVVGDGGQRVPSAVLDVKSTVNTVAWLESAATSIRQVMLASGIAADFGVGPSGFFFSQTAGSVDLRLQSGNAYLDKSGKGLVLRSPNGLVVKTITISNAGEIVVS